MRDADAFRLARDNGAFAIPRVMLAGTKHQYIEYQICYVEKVGDYIVLGRGRTWENAFTAARIKIPEGLFNQSETTEPEPVPVGKQGKLF